MKEVNVPELQVKKLLIHVQIYQQYALFHTPYIHMNMQSYSLTLPAPAGVRKPQWSSLKICHACYTNLNFCHTLREEIFAGRNFCRT